LYYFCEDWTPDQLIEGAFKQQGFIEAMYSFCDGNIQRIWALTVMYWLIVFPYIAYRCLGEAMGQKNLQSYLAGNKAGLSENN